MDSRAPDGGGAFGSARALGASLLAFLRVRTELLGIELREEVERRKRLLVLGLVAALFLALTLLLLAFVVVVFFWDTYRMPAIVGVTLLYAGIGTWALLRYQAAVRDSPPAFSATLGEFQKDLDMWQRRDG